MPVARSWALHPFLSIFLYVKLFGLATTKWMHMCRQPQQWCFSPDKVLIEECWNKHVESSSKPWHLQQPWQPQLEVPWWPMCLLGSMPAVWYKTKENKEAVQAETRGGGWDLACVGTKSCPLQPVPCLLPSALSAHKAPPMQAFWHRSGLVAA